MSFPKWMYAEDGRSLIVNDEHGKEQATAEGKWGDSPAGPFYVTAVAVLPGDEDFSGPPPVSGPMGGPSPPGTEETTTTEAESGDNQMGELPQDVGMDPLDIKPANDMCMARSAWEAMTVLQLRERALKTGQAGVYGMNKQELINLLML